MGISHNSIAVSGQAQKHIVKQKIHALWQFSRPHTIIGTTLQLITAFLLAQLAEPILSIPVHFLVLSWITAIALNLYVVGINQIIDINVDRINKKYLPLAAGDFSRTTGLFIVVTAALLALIFSFMLSIYLFFTVLGIIAIGTAYSVPPIQLKKFPLAAALSIATARGLIFNLGLLMCFESLGGHNVTISSEALSLAIFTFGFCLAIAIMKDIPDIKGDALHDIKTLAVRMGPAISFRVAIVILSVCYSTFIAVGLFHIFLDINWIFVIFHLGVLVFLLWKARQVNPNLSDSIFPYYMLIWKMFYIEFLFFSIRAVLV